MPCRNYDNCGSRWQDHTLRSGGDGPNDSDNNSATSTIFLSLAFLPILRTWVYVGRSGILAIRPMLERRSVAIPIITFALAGCVLTSWLLARAYGSESRGRAKSFASSKYCRPWMARKSRHSNARDSRCYHSMRSFAWTCTDAPDRARRGIVSNICAACIFRRRCTDRAS